MKAQHLNPICEVPGGKRQEAGFSLVEMLIATFLFLTVMAGMLALFNSQSKMARQTTQRADILANARSAMDLITKDVRMAGASLPEGTVIAFINGDNPGVGQAGDGTTGGGDNPAAHPDFIEFMTAPGAGSPCVFSLSESMAGGQIQNAALSVPANGVSKNDLADYMEACGNSQKEDATCNDLWIVENDTGSIYTIIEAARGGGGASPYQPAGGVDQWVNVIHTPGQSAFNVPQGLPGTPSTDATVFNGGRIRLANDFKYIAYRIFNVNGDHPSLQRGEANHCDPNLVWSNIAENVEDLQFSFAYLDDNGDDDNINGILERGPGVTAPYFRYPASYTDSTLVPESDKPHRIRYLRISMIVRADQRDVSKTGVGGAVGDVTQFNEPLFYNRPRVEDHDANITPDARARVFLQEVVDIRNRNLPPM
ncbi:MAG: prepilin-type N-terminal cleavage/methylation domain-containing protein [Acidobacteria bacterium]|nr:prepilin-type N-terminal cleavage/methylation domain-containing protein [Acidobacteriota bacterium]